MVHKDAEQLKDIRGRIRITDSRWISSTHPLQQLTEGAYDVAISNPGHRQHLIGYPSMILTHRFEKVIL